MKHFLKNNIKLLIAASIAIGSIPVHAQFFDKLINAVKEGYENGRTNASQSTTLSMNVNQKGVDISKWDMNPGNSEFLTAVANGNLEQLNTILSEKNSNLEEKNSSGLNALHMAVILQNKQVVELLLKNKRILALIDEDVPNVDGDALGAMTPLCLSSRLDGTGDVTSNLVTAGADVDSQCGNLSWTPLQYAVSWNRSALIPILVNANANVFVKTGDGLSVFGIAWKENSFDAAFSMLDALKVYGANNGIPDLESAIYSERNASYLVTENGRPIYKDDEPVRQKYRFISDPKWDLCGGLTIMPIGNNTKPDSTEGLLLARVESCSDQRGVERLNKYNIKRLAKNELLSIVDKWWSVRNKNTRNRAQLKRPTIAKDFVI